MSQGMKLVLLLAEIFTVASAVIVAIHPNVLYATMALLFAFLGVAIMFLFAGADFLAGAQIVVYVGGVTILVLFAIMLTQWLYQMKLKDVGAKLLAPMVICILGLLPILIRALSELALRMERVPTEKLTAFSASPKTAEIGNALLGTYVLPFEAVTILLLGALVGAVWLARPR